MSQLDASGTQTGIHLVYSFFRNIQVLDTIKRKFMQTEPYKNKTQPTDFSVSCVINASLLLNYVFYVKYTGGVSTALFELILRQILKISNEFFQRPSGPLPRLPVAAMPLLIAATGSASSPQPKLPRSSAIPPRSLRQP